MVIPRKLFYGWPVPRTLFSALSYSQDCYLTAAECRYISPTSGEAIKSYCTSVGITDTTEELQCGPDAPTATLHYLNSQPEQSGSVLLYFHGGGFGNPIDADGHVRFALKVAETASISKVVILEYTLTPSVAYPAQMIQSISALNHMLKVHKPSEITIGGDSAGGNLTLACISHLIKPCPYISPLPLDKGDKLRGALMISPWVKFDTEANSFKSNARTDFLGVPILEEFTSYFKPKRDDIWCEPINADASFWQDIPVKSAIITAGTWEVFYDDILTLAKNMGANPGKQGPIELEASKYEAHIQAVIDIGTGTHKQESMLTAVLDWANRLRNV